jgi:hypothetical protein
MVMHPAAKADACKQNRSQFVHASFALLNMVISSLANKLNPNVAKLPELLQQHNASSGDAGDNDNKGCK